MGKSRDACSQWGNELVLNQRKRVGRLRLLITALVVTSVSIVGAVGTAFATPTSPATGTLEICKAASGESFAGTFGFRVQGLPEVVEVSVGTAASDQAAAGRSRDEVERPGTAWRGSPRSANGSRSRTWGLAPEVAIVAGGERTKRC